MLFNLGESIATEDLVLTEFFDSLHKKEESLVRKIKILEEMKNCGKLDFLQEDELDEFNSLLEKQKLHISFKIQSIDNKIGALFKLLEYMNFLDKKIDKLDLRIIKKKIEELQNHKNKLIN